MLSSSTATRPKVNVNAVAPLTPNAWLRYDVIRRMLPAGVTDVPRSAAVRARSEPGWPGSTVT